MLIRPSRFWHLCLTVVLTTQAACDRNPVPQTPSILLITADTLRADHVGSGAEGVRTPSIDALAARGVTFTAAYAHAQNTRPSHVSLFTSLLPTEHHVLDNKQKYSGQTPALTELLGSRRRTAAFVSLAILSESGLERGFDEFHDEQTKPYWRTAESVNSEVIPWLRSNASQPFFLWVHYSDPHEPYAAPGLSYPTLEVKVDGATRQTLNADATRSYLRLDFEAGRHVITLERSGTDRREIYLRGLVVRSSVEEATLQLSGLESRSKIPNYAFEEAAAGDAATYHYLTSEPGEITVQSDAKHKVVLAVNLEVSHASVQERAAAYADEVRYLDAQIGRLLGALEETGVTDETLIVFTSDHGERLGERGGRFGHGRAPEETVVHVPLILAYPPRLPAGVRVSTPVQHVDVLPTIATLVGSPVLAPIRGKSLVPLEAIPERAVYTFNRGNETGVRLGDLKLIVNHVNGSELLFDLSVDPSEATDISAKSAAVLPELRRHVKLARTPIRQMPKADEELSPEQLEVLRSLGYIQ